MTSIRELRQGNSWTQNELALKVGVQTQTVYLWESGRRIPQVPQMRKLGQVFGICSDLIELDVTKAPADTGLQNATDTTDIKTPASPK